MEHGTFKWFESPLLVDMEHLADIKDYTTIEVPKNWQFEGHGKFVYTDMWYDFLLMFLMFRSITMRQAFTIRHLS